MENKLKRAVIMCEHKNISVADLGLPETESLSLNLRTVRKKEEKVAIIRAINMSEGNISAAAKLLGVTRPTLYDLVKKYGIHFQENQ